MLIYINIKLYYSNIIHKTLGEKYLYYNAFYKQL